MSDPKERSGGLTPEQIHRAAADPRVAGWVADALAEDRGAAPAGAPTVYDLMVQS